MKVMIVCSGNSLNFKFEIDQAFIYDQIRSIENTNSSISFTYFFIRRKGITGYLSTIPEFNRAVRKEKPDIVHAHFALSGLVSIFQRKVPVVCTFHGSDINFLTNRIISLPVQIMAKRLIFVSAKLFDRSILKLRKKSSVIPCGVDLSVFSPFDKQKSADMLNLKSGVNILFSSSFTNAVKNYSLLEKVLHTIPDKDINVIELKNMKREEVALHMNAVDACVMTSLSEGSPQFIKEAMACNCPIVATNVGDIKEVIGDTNHCYVTSFSADEIKNALVKITSDKKRTNGFDRIQKYSNTKIAPRILEVYGSCRRKQ